MERKIPSSLLILGWIACIFYATAAFFKSMHWPGSNIMLMIGAGAFSFFYLPLWLIIRIKGGNKALTFFQFFVLFFSSVMFLIKAMHWPYGGALFNLWFVFVFIIVVPVSVFHLFRTKNKSIEQFHIMVVMFFLFTLIMGSINGGNSRIVTLANSFSKNTEHISNSIERLNVKNNKLYSAFHTLPDKNSNPYYIKANKLKVLTDSSLNYIHNLRKHLIVLNENISEEAADSISLSELRNVTSYDVVTGLLWGYNDFKPRSGKFSGLELKKVVDTFRDSVITFADAETQNFIKAGINLETEPIVNEEGETQDWVESNFRNVTISVALLVLENIKHEIKNAETQVLSDLLNSTKQNSTNLASKVAELGSKLEAEKKQREIENLKNQRELSDLSLLAKNESIDRQNTAIIWFAVVILVCVVMIFFIIRANIIRKEINKELAAQKQVIETKNKEITDSINYARRIQSAILPPTELIYGTLKNSFLLYKPKDVVSGDFYGFIKKDNYALIAIADCTGHGVPGAFMSMIGNEQLNKIINEKGITKPSDILNELHSGVRHALKQDAAGGETRDGMDIALCKYYFNDKKIEYSGAMRPLWIMRNGELIETKADKQPIGGLEADYRKPFTNHTIELQANDSVYMFTDGFADQFGGDKGKKFMLKNFERLLTEINAKAMQDQQTIIDQKFEAWKGDHEQVDDVLVFGIRV